MGFSGGGQSGSTGVAAHKHNTQVGEGGDLKANNSILLGTSISFNGGAETPIEALL